MLKVNKNKAQRLYNEGETIKLYPCKVNLNYILDLGITINKNDRINKELEYDFIKLCNEFIYYNCNYELGYTIKYYVIN